MSTENQTFWAKPAVEAPVEVASESAATVEASAESASDQRVPEVTAEFADAPQVEATSERPPELTAMDTEFTAMASEVKNNAEDSAKKTEALVTTNKDQMLARRAEAGVGASPAREQALQSYERASIPIQTRPREAQNRLAGEVQSVSMEMKKKIEGKQLEQALIAIMLMLGARKGRRKALKAIDRGRNVVKTTTMKNS